jgi:hypothetical protein
MSDFIFSSGSCDVEALHEALLTIRRGESPAVYRFQGTWGTLVVLHGPYNGLQPLETHKHVFVVIGGPVLQFTDNTFFAEQDPVAGTRALYQRWMEGKLDWRNDLSGPFAVIAVDKESGRVTCVTDLMAFIPLFLFERVEGVTIGSHIDSLSDAVGQSHQLDEASVADFVLNDVVTWPYTFYSNIKQMPPAAVTVYKAGIKQTENIYWSPSDQNPFGSITEAADALKFGMQSYVAKVTTGMTEVGHFLSAGEDSRAVSGMLPQRLKRDAFTYLNRMNREGRTAERLAAVYGSHFHSGIRNRMHRKIMLGPATNLVGSGHKFTHAHSLEFVETWDLTRYPAVFGGYLSDSLIKAYHTRKRSAGAWIPFVPQCVRRGETRTQAVTHAKVSSGVLQVVTTRRREHFTRVAAHRHDTAHEWFALWPATMRDTIPNFHATRRLFSSFEPFMSHEAVQVSAATPVSWKLNRRLFNRAMRTFLEPARWILHPDGRLPYFPWWFNEPVQRIVRSTRFATSIVKNGRRGEGHSNPWARENDPVWEEAAAAYSPHFKTLSDTFLVDNLKDLLCGGALTKAQKLNLLQVLHRLRQTSVS